MLWVGTNTQASLTSAAVVNTYFSPYAMINHPSFLALSGSAVRVLIELNLGFNGYNNEEIGLGYTQVETRLRYGSEKVKRAFNQLQEYGFIVCHAQSSFNMKTKKAREWEITFHPVPDRPPSHAWKKIK